MLAYPIRHLRVDDINSRGEVINPIISKNKPFVVMVQGNFCGFCSMAKPAFQQFAKKYENRVTTGTVQIDGQDQSVVHQIKKIIPDYKGVPEYLLFLNGKLCQKKIRGRDIKDLEDFVFQ
jgi:thiol-disulfide isomerase/thioredoxin